VAAKTTVLRAPVHTLKNPVYFIPELEAGYWVSGLGLGDLGRDQCVGLETCYSPIKSSRICVSEDIQYNRVDALSNLYDVKHFFGHGSQL